MTQNLRIPGPTPLPDDVLEAQSTPMIDHRGTEFAEMLHEITASIGTLIGTSNDVLLLTGSGSGAMEAAIVNTLSPGDRVLAVSIGGFGDRFAAITEAFGAIVERFDVEWGEAADPDALAAHLAANPPYRAVLVTLNETSTGVVNPMAKLAAAVRHAPGAPLLVVDGISGLGAMPFDMDAWGVDLVLSASQKAWMAAPGISFAVVGPRAWEARERARMPRSYWDFAEARAWAAKGQTPWTPAVSVLFGLRVGLRRLLAEGPSRTWARHEAVARGAQAGLEAAGLRLVAPPGHRSPTVTAAWLPDGLDWSPFNASMRAKGLVVAGGQGKWVGKILRFGHMGDVDWPDIGAAVTVLAETLGEYGHPSDAHAAAAAGRAAFESALVAR
ncbi:MAG: alanine--glyoxylate aminotransferase family protein [Chloroflexota bacterium]|nr:alanine--glyoxylate aminotransferase family protein [Chloroflexota bacterium]